MQNKQQKADHTDSRDNRAFPDNFSDFFYLKLMSKPAATSDTAVGYFQ
jgi:hypothetical protein